jgi:hypothetical protein
MMSVETISVLDLALASISSVKEESSPNNRGHPEFGAVFIWPHLVHMFEA